jgi:nicotinate dehydrogenase subunit B
VIHVVGPGCYGHNGADDVALDAALLAQRTPGRPVLVKWSRTDEHAWEPYGPPMLVTIEASLDDRHNLVSWSQDAWGMTHSMRPIRSGARRLLGASHRAGATAPPPPRPQLAPEAGIHRNATPIYAIARQRIVKHMIDATPLRTSALRSLGAYANVFAIESFMDEAAHAAGCDPLDFRLRHLDDDRASAVVQAAADRAGWQRSDPSREFGQGRGLAFARYKNAAAYCAVVLDVRVEDPSAEIVVVRAVIAADAGEIVDPGGLANQLEGGLIQAASWTLKERVTFNDTRVESVDWESYPILRFPEVPSVDVVLLERPDFPYLGSGEAAQGPTAAAIANAVFDAIGVRLRDTPFTPARVRDALLAGPTPALRSA